MSDIIFLRSWVPVTPQKLYNPVTSLLVSDITEWRAMKTVGELRRENAIPVPHNQDSVYKVRNYTVCLLRMSLTLTCSLSSEWSASSMH